MNTKQLRDICDSVADEHGFLFIDAALRGSKQLPVIEVFIDGDNALSIEDCATVSAAIHTRLEAESSLNSNFRLEVSSPGTDRPLQYLRQYPKHVSRNFSVQYEAGGQTASLQGKLTAVNGTVLTFRLKDGSETAIEFERIIKAKVLISFS